MRRAIIEMGDQRAKEMGIFETGEYQRRRQRFLEDDVREKTPLDRLEEYGLYLRLLERMNENGKVS